MVHYTTLKYAPPLQTLPAFSNHQSRIHLPSFSFHHITTLNPSVIFVFLAASYVASFIHLQDTFKSILHLHSVPHTSLLTLQTAPSAWLCYSLSIFWAVILLYAHLAQHMPSLLTLHFSEGTSPS